MAKLGTVGIGIMLARLLGPHEFGTYAVAYVALRVLVNLNDLGVSLAIVRWPGDPREIAPTVATISLAVSLVMYGGCYLGAPGYAAAMGAPAAAGVVRVLCLVVIVDGLVSSPAGLLQRQFRQDLRLIADQVNVWLGALLTAALAWAGMGAMSLAVGRLAGCLAALVLIVKFSPAPLRFGFQPARARALLRFGLPLAGSAVITFAVINADQLIVGRVLGVTALGYFVLASNLSSWPVTMFSQPVRNVAPAAFARLQHDPPAMRRAFVSVAGLLGAVALPVCLAISGLAVPLVGFVYGARWLPAAPALAWLAALAALQIAFELSYDYFVVLALSRVVLTLQLVWLVVLIPALAAGALTGGVSGTAQAEIAVAAGLALPWYLWELRKAGIRGRALAGRLALPVAGAAVAGLACLAASRLLPGRLPALTAGGMVSVLVIGLLLYHLRGDLAVLLRRPRKLAAQGRTASPGMAAPGAAGPLPGVAGVADPAESAASEPVPGPALAPDGQVLDGPVLDGPVLDGPVLGGPVLGGPVLDGQVLDGPVLDGPVLDGQVLDGPVLDGPVLDVPDQGCAPAHEGRDPRWPDVAEGLDQGWADAGEGRGPGWDDVAEGRGPGWDDVAAGRGAGWPGEAADADPEPYWAMAADAPARPAVWPGLAARVDATGPLPLCRAIPGLVPPGAVPPAGPLSGLLPPPLYRATARALGWEPRARPAAGGPGGRGPGDGDLGGGDAAHGSPGDADPDGWDLDSWDLDGWDLDGPDSGDLHPEDWGRAGPGGRNADGGGEKDWLPADWHPDCWRPGGSEPGRPSL